MNIENVSFLVLVFLVLVVGVLLLSKRVKLIWVKPKTGKSEYGPLMWPCPNCNVLVHKNMTMDHLCEV